MRISKHVGRPAWELTVAKTRPTDGVDAPVGGIWKYDVGVNDPHVKAEVRFGEDLLERDRFRQEAHEFQVPRVPVAAIPTLGRPDPMCGSMGIHLRQ